MATAHLLLVLKNGIPITWDPKAFDPQQTLKKYEERGLQIATELFLCFFSRQNRSSL
jgi:hypothetical protein